MKILIAYDGSVCSDNAIVDLRRAGLPAVAEVIVLSVAEMSPRAASIPVGALGVGPGLILAEGMESEESCEDELGAAKAIASQGAERLRSDFPGWKIDAEAWVDAAGSAIARKAHAWKPDLVVIGSHGRSGISRWVLGSVSQYVLRHVTCSVRISRHRLHSQERSIRSLIAVDGSDNARAAVTAVAERNWPTGAEARVVGVLDSRIAVAAATTLEGTIPVAIEDEFRRRMSQAVHEAAKVLTQSGLPATHQVLAGKPDEVLLAEAEKWSADCMFVGAGTMSGLERFLLGSVSAPVASRAHCSVEVVREPVD
jgi:nucleotide-binding universal stress UspA family protein